MDTETTSYGHAGKDFMNFTSNGEKEVVFFFFFCFFFGGVGEGERERERERERKTETERQRDRARDRQTDRGRETHLATRAAGTAHLQASFPS